MASKRRRNNKNTYGNSTAVVLFIAILFLYVDVSSSSPHFISEQAMHDGKEFSFASHTCSNGGMRILTV